MNITLPNLTENITNAIYGTQVNPTYECLFASNNEAILFILGFSVYVYFLVPIINHIIKKTGLASKICPFAYEDIMAPFSIMLYFVFMYSIDSFFWGNIFVILVLALINWKIPKEKSA